MIESPFPSDFFEKLPNAASPTAQMDAVVDAVEQLEPILRELVEMLIWERVTKTEAANRLDISRQTVYSMWDEALEVLRGTLEDV